MESRSESTIAEWVRNHKTQATAATGVFLLVVVLLVTPPRRASLPPEVSLTGPVSELLADVRGQDVLERLRAGQAAMRQEMAWVRHVLGSQKARRPRKRTCCGRLRNCRLNMRRWREC